MENKKILFIGLGVIIFIIGLSFYFLGFKKQGAQETTAVKTESGEQSTTTEKKIKKQWPMMVEAGNATKTLCDSLSGADDKKNCYARISYEAASLNNNPRFCLDIDDYVLRSDCIFRQLVATNDINQCSRIPDRDFRNRCLEQIGMETKGSEYCAKLDGKEEKIECVDRTLAMAMGNPKEKTDDKGQNLSIKSCEGLNTLEYGFLCQINAMRVRGGSCDDLTGQKAKDLCVSRVIYSKAKSRTDCDKIPNERFKKVCVSIFDNAGNKDYKFDDDNDGLTNDKELWIGTDPFNADTDGDGLSDYDEYNKYHTDPIEPDDKAKVLADYAKKEAAAVGKDLNKDSDNDGLSDFDEIFYGTDPNNPDTDGDGMKDGEEIRTGHDPLNPNK